MEGERKLVIIFVFTVVLLIVQNSLHCRYRFAALESCKLCGRSNWISQGVCAYRQFDFL